MVARARIEELGAARAASDAVFARLRPDAMRTRAVRERHRFVFYLGHLEAFDANLLRHELEIASPRAEWDARFARGIDPIGRDGLPTDDDDDWPPTDEVRAYGRGLRDAIDRALVGAAKNETLVDAMIEHRLMHVETLAYLAHQLPIGMVAPAPAPEVERTPPPRAHRVEIPAGPITLGARDGFAWDNERDPIVREVGAFAIDAYPVTQRDWLAFVEAGGYADRSLWTDDDWAWRTADDIQAPRAWRRRDGAWKLRAYTSEIELPLDAPVYVSHAEASAYARWRRARLPTEAEWQRAAYGSPSGERRHPWGDAAPDANGPPRGNFDLVRDDATSVTAHPAGASAWGVHDLAGNGWEWTSSKFAPLPGFAPQPFYPGYSADFFDDRHYVMKGGSARTAARLLRRSFRNWFQPHYPHVYATLRLVES